MGSMSDDEQHRKRSRFYVLSALSLDCTCVREVQSFAHLMASATKRMKKDEKTL